MSATHDIFLNPAAIDAEAGRLDTIADTLAAEAARYQRALAEAAHGDPHGYLDAGLHDGYAALAAARQAEAEMREVIRRMRATVQALVQHDHAAAISPAPVVLRSPSASVAPAMPDLALDTVATTSAAASHTDAAVPFFNPPLIEPSEPALPLAEPIALNLEEVPADITEPLRAAAVEPIIVADETAAPALPPAPVPTPAPTPAVVLLSPVQISTAPLLPPTAPPADRDRPWWQRGWDMLRGFVAGIFAWLWDLLKGIWGMLRLYASSMANGSWWAWGLTILAIIVVVVLALTGVLEAALVIAGIVLLVVGVVASIMAIIGNVQQWQADPDMSDYDRSRLVGRSVMDVISAILAGAGALKLGRAAQVANELRGLEALARGGASVADLLRRGYTVEQIVALLRSSGRVAGTPLEAFATSRVIDSLEDAVNLQKAGRLAGLEDWLRFNAPKAPAELSDAAGELREAERLAGQYPGSVIRVGREANAPVRPGTTEAMQEFDLAIEDSAGVVQRTVEMTSVEDATTQVSNLTPSVRHAADKVVSRINDGLLIPGAHDVTIQMQLDVGTRSLGSSGSLEVLSDGTINTISGKGVVVRNQNFFDNFAANIPRIDNSQYLSRITLVDKSGNVLATYKRVGVDWIWLP